MRRSPASVSVAVRGLPTAVPEEAFSSTLRVAVVPSVKVGAALSAVGVAVASDDVPGPTLFRARTWKVWSVPLVRLETVTLRAAPPPETVVHVAG